jgi:hypothetical protein
VVWCRIFQDAREGVFGLLLLLQPIILLWFI